MSFLDKLEQAVQQGALPVCFTTEQVKQWIRQYNIINDKSQKPFADSTINSTLSSSVIDSSSTKTDKRLYSFENPRRYSFNPQGCN